MPKNILYKTKNINQRELGIRRCLEGRDRVISQVTKPNREASKMSLLELFCAVDDFCKEMDEEQIGKLLGDGKQQRRRAGQLSDSEALTIMIHFHTYGELRYQSQYRNFKAYYQQHVQEYLQAEFPGLISYGRFVQRMPRLLGWLVYKASPSILAMSEKRASLSRSHFSSARFISRDSSPETEVFRCDSHFLQLVTASDTARLLHSL